MQSRLKCPKESFFRNPGFSKVAKFTRAESSLYQALSIGLIEILIRFKESPELIGLCRKSVENLIPSPQDSEHPSLKFAREYNVEHHLNNLKIIIDRVLSLPYISTSFYHLNCYAEDEQYRVTTSFDLGMRAVLGSILPGMQTLHEKMMRCQPVDDDVLLFNFAIKFNLQIDVVTSEGTTVYKKHLPGTYPLMILWHDSRNGYALLYTDESLSIETNSNYPRHSIQDYPFFPRHLSRQTTAPTIRIEETSPLVIDNSLVRSSTDEYSGLSVQEMRESEIKPEWHKPGENTTNVFRNTLNIPLPPSLTPDGRKSPVPDQYRMIEPGHKSSGEVVPDVLNKNSVPRAALDLKPINHIPQPMYGPQPHRVLDHQNNTKECDMCKKFKDSGEFTAITCDKPATCQICSECRIKSNSMCQICGRLYKSYEKGVLEIFEMSMQGK